ncbi:hypothetical protein [Paraburkholderia sp. BR10954]
MKRRQYSIGQIMAALKPADLIAPDLLPGAVVYIDITVLIIF